MIIKKLIDQNVNADDILLQALPMLIDQHTYRKAFQDYLRKGTPIAWSLKQARPSTHYIWRTRRDGKVRSAHADREGQIFAWDNPPPGGHPGEDYNCRCTAEPYYGDSDEFVKHELTGLGGGGDRWENHDFVYHFYFGEGQTVSLRQIGHLNEIVEHWADTLGIFDKWTEQIIRTIRREGVGHVTDYFNRSYDFTNVEFSHGNSVVEGNFSGNVRQRSGMYLISGQTHYTFSDVFTDPIDIREFVTWIRNQPDRLHRFLQQIGASIGIGNGPTGEAQKVESDDVSELFRIISDLGGTAYSITGTWSSHLEAKVFADPVRSKY